MLSIQSCFCSKLVQTAQQSRNQLTTEACPRSVLHGKQTWARWPKGTRTWTAHSLNLCALSQTQWQTRTACLLYLKSARPTKSRVLKISLICSVNRLFCTNNNVQVTIIKKTMMLKSQSAFLRQYLNQKFFNAELQTSPVLEMTGMYA